MITDIYYSFEQNILELPNPKFEGDKAAQLVEECAENLILTNDLNTLSNWLEGLPPDLYHSRPQLSLYKTLILLISGKLDEVEQSLANLEFILEGYYARRPDTPAADRRKLAGEIAAIRSTLAILEHNLDRTIQLSDKTRAEMTSTGTSWWLTSIDLNLAAAYRWNKNTVAVALSLSSALATTIAHNSLACTLKVLRFMSEFYYSQGDLRLAATTCQHLLQLSASKDKDARYDVYRGYTTIALGKIAFKWNKLSEACHFFQQGLEIGLRLRHLDITYKCYSHLAQLKKAQSDLEMAHEFMNEIEQLEKQQSLKLPNFNRTFRTSLLAAWRSGSTLFPEPVYYSSPVVPRLLNNQEIEIIHLLENEFSNREIATRMIVTENTVKYHLKRIFQKLQVNDRTQAVRRSRELHLI